MSLLANFHDSLDVRARQLRFRGIGNPFNFLDSIGIVPIKEFIFKGATIIDVAEQLNIPITYLREWISQNNFQSELEDAAIVSAEGYIARGEKMLREAKSDFEFKKAKAILEHGRFMAEKKDKKQYGKTEDKTIGPAAGVTYIFQVGNNQTNFGAQPVAEQATRPAIDASSTRVHPSEDRDKATAPAAIDDVLSMLPQHIFNTLSSAQAPLVEIKADDDN